MDLEHPVRSAVLKPQTGRLVVGKTLKPELDSVGTVGILYVSFWMQIHLLYTSRIAQTHSISSRLYFPLRPSTLVWPRRADNYHLACSKPSSSTSTLADHLIGRQASPTQPEAADACRDCKPQKGLPWWPSLQSPRHSFIS